MSLKKFCWIQSVGTARAKLLRLSNCGGTGLGWELILNHEEGKAINASLVSDERLCKESSSIMRRGVAASGSGGHLLMVVEVSLSKRKLQSLHVADKACLHCPI